MRIAIDLRPLQSGHQYRGIGAYLTNVLSRFPFEHTKHTFIFIRYPDSNPVAQLELPVQKYEEVVLQKPPEAHGWHKLPMLMRKRLSPQFGDLRKHRPDLYFQPDFLLGLPGIRKMKKTIVMYDLIPLVLKDEYLPSWKKLLAQPGLGKRRRLHIVLGAWLKERGYRAGLKNFKKADRVLCISKSTAQDAQDLLGLPEAKLRAIPLAASISAVNNKSTALQEIKNPYLLFIGGVDQRRRLADLVHAFNLLNGRGRTIDLVLSGKELADIKLIPNIEARDAIMNSSYKTQVHLLGYTSQEEKAELIRHAFTFVYPSTYEGFGLPALEAMTLGCPVIAYKNSSLPEITGKAAILLEETGGRAIRDAVMELQDNSKTRNRLAEKGRKQAAKFSWNRCASLTFSEISH